jgi:hypothetical protein
MPAVKKFTITPLEFDTKLVEQVSKRRAGGENHGRYRPGVH